MTTALSRRGSRSMDKFHKENNGLEAMGFARQQ